MQEGLLLVEATSKIIHAQLKPEEPVEPVGEIEAEAVVPAFVTNCGDIEVPEKAVAELSVMPDAFDQEEMMSDG
jgi:hypothetical protein